MSNIITSLNQTSLQISKEGIKCFPDGTVGKESACNAGDSGLIPGLRRSLGEENGNPFQYSCLGNPIGERSLGSPWCCKSWTWLSDYTTTNEGIIAVFVMVKKGCHIVDGWCDALSRAFATKFSKCKSALFSSVQFSRSVMSDSLRPHESQHARPPCPSPTPRVHSNSRPLSQWCHPAISSSVIPFSSCPQSLPA